MGVLTRQQSQPNVSDFEAKGSIAKIYFRDAVILRDSHALEVIPTADFKRTQFMQDKQLDTSRSKKGYYNNQVNCMTT